MATFSERLTSFLAPFLSDGAQLIDAVTFLQMLYDSDGSMENCIAEAKELDLIPDDKADDLRTFLTEEMGKKEAEALGRKIAASGYGGSPNARRTPGEAFNALLDAPLSSSRLTGDDKPKVGQKRQRNSDAAGRCRR